MSQTWKNRKTRLSSLLNSDGDEDAEALALDRILHGQSVIGKTSKTTEVDALRFSDKDLNVVGTLEYGQYGVIDVVTCKFDGAVYVRKSTEKRFALRTHDQCFPQHERDILLRARKTDCDWAPHLLCAFHTPTHINLVMDYAEGGTLWDALESSPHDGRVLESDLRWWMPQVVSAIHWCHSQDFVHRDIKPHNFVLTPTSRLLLIDFGSAAPLLQPAPDGSQRVPKQYCLVPCGTCDYISPEILQAHEEALVALEMSEDGEELLTNSGGGGYGRETDWWSMGAMLYEMAYGVAPFFAKDIRQTYVKITDHYNSLKFNKSIPISLDLQDLLRRLLTSAELRLGRESTAEIKKHPFFSGTKWSNLTDQQRPSDLHVPQFTYSTPVEAGEIPQPTSNSQNDMSESRPFAFSGLFQSSPLTSSIRQATPSQNSGRSILRELPVASFIGFSWGPPKDAFSKKTKSPSPPQGGINTPRPLQRLSVPSTPFPRVVSNPVFGTPHAQRYPFATPIRPNAMTPFQTLPRASTIRRTAQRRIVSDREAMKQLVDCVGMSARKRVLESGRKPRVLTSFSRSSALKELRFDTSIAIVGDGGISYKLDATTASTSQSEDTFGASLMSASASASNSVAASMTGSMLSRTQELLVPDLDTSFSSADTDLPASPSPSPRPGSAMSMMSRRSQTPTASSFNLRAVQLSGGRRRSSSLSSVLTQPSLPASIPEVHEAEHDLSLPFTHDSLDDFERRHGRLIEDIIGIERRLRKLATALRDSH